ncbi:MAG: hypothetical protein KAR13_01190, partial [Desulfobulbaceae bacterium]|nr:hypothetical protein [Desulfobulbaceae bacterium]
FSNRTPLNIYAKNYSNREQDDELRIESNIKGVVSKFHYKSQIEGVRSDQLPVPVGNLGRE